MACVFFFFYKKKTTYVFSACLVAWELCKRTSHIWHPPLFNLALYGIVLGLLFHLLRWMQS
ncbi:DUF1656 domain-containing protein [Stenotrophomonas geniculata]|uniref:DUF1656 domain-containing protein n=1 Tax=Stenotrophomonas geniculata TaxID=86188 RepID=UPI003D2C45BF